MTTRKSTKKKSEAETERERRDKQAKLDWESEYSKALDFMEKHNTPDRVIQMLSLGLRFGFITEADHNNRLLEHASTPVEKALLKRIEELSTKYNSIVDSLQDKPKVRKDAQ